MEKQSRTIELVDEWEELLLTEVERAKKEGIQSEKLNALGKSVVALVTLRASGMLRQLPRTTA